MPHSSPASRSEPRLGGPGPAPLRAPSPLRPAMSRPAAGETGQVPRFASVERQPGEAGRITLTAPERLTVSSQISENTGPSRGVLRFLGFLLLLGLAAVGGVTLLHSTLGVLPF